MIVAEFIADFLSRRNLSQVFTVVGGGAMYLNDSLGHHPGLTVTYTHHEQAAAIAAEAHARVTSRPAVVCVTSGPGGTNAMTGCLCSYMGSIPMLILSGQVRYPFTVRSSGLPLRTVGEQEFDICKAAAAMTKYCEMVVDATRIRYHLEKAVFVATSGRPGPAWLDIPLDVQNASIAPEFLQGFDPQEYAHELPPPISDETASGVLQRIQQSRRPVLYVGLGVRLAGAQPAFIELAEHLNIPVVTGVSSVDCISSNHRLYAGRAGTTGTRAGNFAIQNADLLLVIGSRLSLKHTGYNVESWARSAYKIVCDIDRFELQREHLKIDCPIWADAADFIACLTSRLAYHPLEGADHEAWRRQCRDWVARYPVVTTSHDKTQDGKVSLYAFFRELSKLLPEDHLLVTTAGTARVVGAQAMDFKPGQRFIVNVPAAPMGYCLPAAIGACLAMSRQTITLIAADGGLQMNIQELQTIKHHRLPIRIIVINNEGYHSIRQTQRAYFRGRSHVGIGEESGDLSFPDLSKIATAYGFQYLACRTNPELPSQLGRLMELRAPVICEVFVTKEQGIEPKAASRRLEDGRMVSAPLEDMAPFLSRVELEENMLIPLWLGSE